MKISVVTSTYPRYQGDGVGSFIHSMSASMVQLGHTVTVFAPYDPEVVSDWQSDVDVRRVRFVWPNRWAKLGHARSLSGDVRLQWHAYPLVMLFSAVAILHLLHHTRREKPDVIYAQWLVPGGFIGAVVSRITGIPLVVSLHGSDVFVAERYKIFRPLVRFIFRTACHVIACSTDLAQRAIGLGLPAAHATVIPYGVDIDRYVPAPQSRSRIREQLSISDAQPVIMAMGRLVYKKGFSYFIRAAALVLKQFPMAHFIIAGDGDLRHELENIAQSLSIGDNISFIGHIPWADTPAHLAMVDILVVPSVIDQAGNVDGLPNVLLESLASGCAVIASRVAGIPEVIEDGKNGLLVPQKDEGALASAIRRLLADADLRRRLGNTARQMAVAQLSWGQTTTYMASILQACVEGHNR